MHTKSRTFSTNSGSFESLKASVRCGCRPKARQMRLTVLWLNPHRVAMARVLQCVASRGVASSVSVTICSTWASLMRRGAPGRGSSSNPSSRAATNRLRHLPTVCLVRRSARATRVDVRPLAHAKITRALCANAGAVVGRRLQRSNASRSSSVSLSTGMGRPIAMRVLLSIARTLGPYILFHLFQTHETSGTGKADEHPRVVAGPQGPPLELQGEISWGGSRMPKQAKISPGHGFKGSVDEDEAARIIVAGLVSNGRHAPPTQRGAIEEHREARVWRVGSEL